jgi:hypothetical protein
MMVQLLFVAVAVGCVVVGAAAVLVVGGGGRGAAAARSSAPPPPHDPSLRCTECARPGRFPFKKEKAVSSVVVVLRIATRDALA